MLADVVRIRNFRGGVEKWILVRLLKRLGGVAYQECATSGNGLCFPRRSAQYSRRGRTTCCPDK